MLLYNLIIRFYGALIKLAGLKNEKAALWVKGRTNWKPILEDRIGSLSSGNRIWMHCASYGEFEQGRPLMEAIRTKYPDVKIILSFFSPSGYEAFKNNSGADVTCYLPLDTLQNARDFINIIKPQTVIFIKYEFWLNFLSELSRQNVPSFLVSAVFKPHHPFFKWYGGIFKKSLSTFKMMFIQDNNSASLLENISVKNYTVCGDTRFDRVIKIKQDFTTVPELERFKADNLLIVAGSTWPKDEALLLKAFSELKIPEIKLLLVPHQVDASSINATVERLEVSGLSFSLFSKGVDLDAKVLLLDVMGLLSRTYYYADCAYIGGGFNTGLHNTLEPAVFGIPVSFYGKEFDRFNEVVDLVQMQVAERVKDAGHLAAIWNKQVLDESFRKETRKKLGLYFEANSNVSEKVLNVITQYNAL